MMPSCFSQSNVECSHCLHIVPHFCIQVNPLAEDDKGRLLAADAKLGFDDNAAFRQKDIFALKDDSQIDPR